MAISIKSRKAKGRLLQNWVAKKVSDLLGIPWGKDEAIQGREMGQQGTDLKLYGEAKEKFNFSVECKACESWALPTWINQAKDNQLKGTYWLLVCKKNREKPIIVIDAEAFFEIQDELIKLKEKLGWGKDNGKKY